MFSYNAMKWKVIGLLLSKFNGFVKSENWHRSTFYIQCLIKGGFTEHFTYSLYKLRIDDLFFSRDQGRGNNWEAILS